MGTTELAAELPHPQPPPPAKRPGLLVRPSGDGLCQRTRDGIKPSVARGGLRSAGANRRRFANQILVNGLPIGKSAIRQVGKPAVRSPSPPPFGALWPQTATTLPRFREKRPLLSNGKWCLG
jgi:hypothetical protein